MGKDIITKGLVVKVIDVGESDRIITLLTPEEGKLSVSGKGVRNIKSHRLHTSQLFCFCEFVLSEKNDRFYIKEASLIEDFYALREDLVSLSLAQYIMDVTSTVTITGEDQSDILSLVLNCLYLLSTKKKSATLIKAVFELRLACLLGFTPDLSCCAGCGKKDGSYFFDIDGGTVYCTECQTSGKGASEGALIAALDGILLDTMRYICIAPDKRIFAFPTDNELESELSPICEKYLIEHLERSFDTLGFYKSICI